MPTQPDDLSDAELNEIVARAAYCPDCGGSHPDEGEQAAIILIARKRGWPTQAAA